jgi:hypothetical protein
VKIVLLLSWYDESPAWLSTVVTGFGRICDEVVAVDGAYQFYPEARPRSHPEQAEAIHSAAEAAGIGCTIHRPREPFEGNEVEKRNLTLRLAGAHDPDWVLVADGDYHVVSCDPDGVRGALANTDLLVATYELRDGQDWLDVPGMADRAAVTPIDTQWQHPTRDIYRWTDDLSYGPAHWTIWGTYDSRLKYLKGPRQEPCLDLGDSLVAVHRSRHRPLVRRTAAETYYRRRDEHGIESIAGLVRGG